MYSFCVAVNCWPNETGSGCDVNIEFDLEKDDMELNDVVITIPLPYVFHIPSQILTSR